ncbi:MAG: hypothetical protein ACWGMZ_09530 [Thermoguttaceae bacterium]
MNRHTFSGFSLLEVILALGILLGAIALLGELGRLGLRNAKLTQDLARAQFLCKSKLAEFTSGITMPTTIQATPFDDIDQDGGASWIYSVETQQIDSDGLLAVQVAVTRDLPATRHPVAVSLIQWMIDPSLETSTASSATTNSNSGYESGGINAN